MPSVISDDRQYILGSNILALNPIKLSDNVSGLIPYSKRRRFDASTQWSRTLCSGFMQCQDEFVPAHPCEPCHLVYSVLDLLARLCKSSHPVKSSFQRMKGLVRMSKSDVSSSSGCWWDSKCARGTGHESWR